MKEKLINTIVKLGANTLLDEAVKSLINTIEVSNTTDGGGQLTLKNLPNDSVLFNCRVVGNIKQFTPREIGILMWRLGSPEKWWVIHLYVIKSGESLYNTPATIEIQYL